jgi:hypothetical protein
MDPDFSLLHVLHFGRERPWDHSVQCRLLVENKLKFPTTVMLQRQALMTKVVFMSSQSQYTNLCKACFNLFLLIKVSRPDQHAVRAHVCVSHPVEQVGRFA